MSVIPNIAYKYLSKQKRHSVLTIIAVVLSVMMMTVSLVGVGTVLRTKTNISASVNGKYHVLFNDLTKDQLITISNMDIFDETNKYSISYYTDEIYSDTITEDDTANYLIDENGRLVADSFLRIQSDKCGLLPENLVRLKSGRLPEKNGEIVLSLGDLEYFGLDESASEISFLRVECSAKDENAEKYEAENGFVIPSELDAYTINGGEVITYTITGIAENNSIISYSDTMMRSFTPQNDKLLMTYGDEQYDLYWDMHYAFKDLDLEIDDYDFSFNQEYLNMINKGVDAKYYNSIMFALIYLAILFIMFCVRLVIDNSFEISAKERIRQFGVLMAVGSSKKQILGIMFWEAMFLSLVGVPVGIVLGCGFSYVIFEAVRNIEAVSALSNIYNMKDMLQFCIEPWAIISAVLIGVFWVIISAVGTGMRVIKLSPVEAMRNAEKKPVIGKYREPKGKISVERTIASRSIKKNKKRYGITLLSMVLSIVMFTGFSYALELIESRIVDEYSEENSPFDYEIEVSGDANGFQNDYVSSFLQTGYFSNVQYDSFFSLLVSVGEDDDILGNAGITGYYMIELHPVSENTYKKLTGLDDYNSFVENNAVMICNHAKDEDNEFDQYGKAPDIISVTPVIDYALGQTVNLNVMGFYDTEMTLYRSDSKTIKGIIADSVYESFVDYYGRDSRYMTYEDSITGEEKELFSGVIYADSADREYADAWLKRHFENYRDNYSQKRMLDAFISMLRIGGYTAIAIFTLIAVVNIVNIISTNVLNRTAEIAMLRACGMSGGQVIRMVLYESIMYAFTSALISLGAVELIIFGIQAPFMFGSDAFAMYDLTISFSYTRPLGYLLIAVIAAFAAAAAAALPAAKRIIDIPIVDAIESVE